MIIVSQDKKTILNFDNVVSIYVIRDAFSEEKGLKNYNIDYSTNDEINIVIGTYATEKRAKEVLQEIIKSYTNWNNLVYGQPTGECRPKYEMPKEW